MPCLNLKVVGSHLHRCNDSSSRYMRENHYTIFVQFENFLRFQVQDTHNASFYSYVLDRVALIRMQR